MCLDSRLPYCSGAGSVFVEQGSHADCDGTICIGCQGHLSAAARPIATTSVDVDSVNQSSMDAQGRIAKAGSDSVGCKSCRLQCYLRRRCFQWFGQLMRRLNQQQCCCFQLSFAPRALPPTATLYCPEVNTAKEPADPTPTVPSSVGSPWPHRRRLLQLLRSYQASVVAISGLPLAYKECCHRQSY